MFSKVNWTFISIFISLILRFADSSLHSIRHTTMLLHIRSSGPVGYLILFTNFNPTLVSSADLSIIFLLSFRFMILCAVLIDFLFLLVVNYVTWDFCSLIGRYRFGFYEFLLKIVILYWSCDKWFHFLCEKMFSNSR